MQIKEYLILSTHSNRLFIDFFQFIKIIVNKISIIEYPIFDNDLTLYILNGLGPKFREIVTSICTSDTSLKFEETPDLLVGHESYPHWLETQSVSNMFAITNYSHRQVKSFRMRKPNNHHSFNKGCDNNLTIIAFKNISPNVNGVTKCAIQQKLALK